MIAAFDWNAIAPVIIQTLFQGGLAVGIVALLKVNPEKGQIAVVTAQGALQVQSGVIKDLRDELDRVRKELDTAKHEIYRLNIIITDLKTNQDRHDKEVKGLLSKT